MLLLTMYLSPLVAVALYWRAQAGVAEAAAADGVPAGAWSTLRAAGRPEGAIGVALLAFAASVLLAGLAAGLVGAAAFAGGVLVSAFAAALVHSEASAWKLTAKDGDAGWKEALALSQTVAAIYAGSLGALAWFFADPAGASVLVLFATGASAAALFLRIAAAAGSSLLAEPASMLSREEATGGANWQMSAHLAAFAAALLIAADADAGVLRPLAGLLGETETLRSELLLLPISFTVLFPLLSLLLRPVSARLLQQGGARAVHHVERLTAVAGAACVLAIVHWSGLAISVATAFLAGMGLRQVALLVDEADLRGGGGHRSATFGPSALPGLLAFAAFFASGWLAGGFGVALVALGMTSSFVTAAASASARRRLALREGAVPPGETGIAEATTGLSAALALLAALAPVIALETLHRGVALPLPAVALPGLVAAAVAAAAVASSLGLHISAADRESDGVRASSQAILVAAGLPLAAGCFAGAAVATGVVLGFVCCAAAGRASEVRGAGLARPVLLAWARVLALFALIGAPLMS